MNHWLLFSVLILLYYIAFIFIFHQIKTHSHSLSFSFLLYLILFYFNPHYIVKFIYFITTCTFFEWNQKLKSRIKCKKRLNLEKHFLCIFNMLSKALER